MFFKRLGKSFVDAGRGLKLVFESEANFRVQIIAGLAALVLSVIFPLLRWERILLILLVFLVLVMEIVNTAVEYISDLLKPRLYHYVGVVKDIMAGAVFLTSLLALTIGLIIFWPHFNNLFR
jgi:diacylglycerol kinase